MHWYGMSVTMETERLVSSIHTRVRDPSASATMLIGGWISVKMDKMEGQISQHEEMGLNKYSKI